MGLNPPLQAWASYREQTAGGSQSADNRQVSSSHFTELPYVQEWVKGNPGPFGLLCFGMTTCMLMFIKTRWSEPSFLATVFSYAFFYGGMGQFIAGVLELVKGNTFGGTAFASYGAFWMGWFMLEYLSTSDPALFHIANTAKTLWCTIWAILTAGFSVVSLRKNGCLVTVFMSLVATFILLAAGVRNQQAELAAGYVGIFCGGSAIYGALASLFVDELGAKLPGVRPVDLLTWRGQFGHTGVVQPADIEGGSAKA